MKEDCLMCLLSNACSAHTASEAKNEHKGRSIQSFRKGDVLYHQDNLNEHIYYIHHGVVKIFSLSSGGKEVIHTLLAAGDLAGISALTGNKMSPFSAEVIEDAKICFFEKNQVLELFRTRPVFAESLLSRVSKAQEEAYHRNDHLINFKVRERMARGLLELGKLFGEEKKQGIQIKLRLSREELASFIGIAPETAIRFLSEFKRKKYITEIDRQIIIIDQVALEKEVNKNLINGGKQV
jgi:CRP-like cAMP-binding protein